MNIWVDLSNAPHVNFFQQLLKDWKKEGHTIIVTARPLSNTIQLLERNNINFHEIGRHYGKNKVAKILGLLIRCIQLWWFLRCKKIDVAISQSSFYSPLVAWVLRCDCVYTNDNEFAKGNYVGFIFAQRILLPEALKKWASTKFFRNKTIYYPGVKEGIYLHDTFGKVRRSANRTEDNHIFFRPEPWTAEYHQKNNFGFSALLEGLAKKYIITVLPRGDEQALFFKAMNNSRIRVQKTALTIMEIVEQCDVFIGGGGSMSREFSFLGVKTLSTYQGELLSVDSYLIEKKVMKHIKTINAETVSQALEKMEESSAAEDLRGDGKKSYNLVKQSINFT